jgi:hypothetical protein
MNKTIVFVTFSILVGLGIIGAVVLLVFKPESLGQFTTLLITVLGLATTAAGTFYMLGQQAEKIQKIDTQTNGTNRALQEENQRLTNIIIEKGLDGDEDQERVA